MSTELHLKTVVTSKKKGPYFPLTDVGIPHLAPATLSKSDGDDGTATPAYFGETDRYVSIIPRGGGAEHVSATGCNRPVVLSEGAVPGWPLPRLSGSMGRGKRGVLVCLCLCLCVKVVVRPVIDGASLDRCPGLMVVVGTWRSAKTWLTDHACRLISTRKCVHACWVAAENGEGKEWYMSREVPAWPSPCCKTLRSSCAFSFCWAFGPHERRNDVHH
ncbi:uncharacterized protein B0I36DRAFT_335923 [Microdochium trichocladiopsis]|uniref:Uncharacterized protein n=1 Tax=Microdochium trichocladiopsis TaxID=1682393 RepID=A0A9P8XV18_9PEZI|nr:uncharacterized protein B0I36DRAFT_335923 [Microdochium trichocladiopsis]KAH7018415.1 hypothetical protein B0I36DRAFT_335923 [Microdochium trichocladiopsis]